MSSRIARSEPAAGRCLNRSWSPAGPAISAVHACKALARGRLSAGRLRQSVARPSRGGALGAARRRRSRRSAHCSSAAIDARIGLRRSCISPPLPMSASRWPIRRCITATISAAPCRCSRRCARPASARSSSPRPAPPTASPTVCRSARRHRSAGQSLWRDQAGDRAGAALVRRGLWDALGRRCAISTPPAPIPKARSARSTSRKPISIPLVLQAALGRGRPCRDLRHRLSDPGRHRDPRLHPCRRPRRRRICGRSSIWRRAAPAPRSTSAPAAAIRCAR